MTQPDVRRGRPRQDGLEEIASPTPLRSLVEAPDALADLDAYAEHLSGRFVVQVVIDAGRDHRRTHVYRSCAAAERCVERARDRGQTAHVSLVQMLPVGVVVGLGGGR